MDKMGSFVNLNVGGTVYTTSLLTLTKYPHSMLSRMFSGNIPSSQDEHGNYVIDRDGRLFRFILTYLRSSYSQLVLPEGFNELEMLLEEAEFYQIPPLIEQIKELIEMRRPKINDLQSSTCQVFSLNVGGTVFPIHRKYLEPVKETLVIEKHTLEEDVKEAIWYKFMEEYIDRHLVLGNVWKTINSTDCPRDKDGNFIIDCNPTNFQYILNFLQSANYCFPKDISDNEMFYLRQDLYKLEMGVLAEFMPLDVNIYHIDRPECTYH